MINRMIAYGLAAGLLTGGNLFVTLLLWRGEDVGSSGAIIGYTVMLLAFAAIFVAVKRQRDVAGGGVIGFWPALALGLGISAVAGIVYTLAWEAGLAVTGIDFGGDYARATIAARRAAGASAAELAKLTAEMNAFRASYANPLIRLPMTFAEIFPVGVVVSLVAAALLRNPRFLPARRADARQS
ncbi:DUF4199 domain-containing protein [Sphingomonas sp.]|uniref:DUF4199 domain-containing protein n=1 Tax=Sphingomonas sp. TaxID=28214 RepID=UPI001D8957E8|nr:DUF4199 domain-containing protein [Sphingomonas sp.]MBX9796584.1 DUF4199 domain-containing protein [Sphingomonas sp.]